MSAPIPAPGSIWDIRDKAPVVQSETGRVMRAYQTVMVLRLIRQRWLDHSNPLGPLDGRGGEED